MEILPSTSELHTPKTSDTWYNAYYIIDIPIAHEIESNGIFVFFFLLQYKL